MRITKVKYKDALIQALLFIYLIFTVYPVFLMVITALKTNAEIIKHPLSMPIKLNFSGFIKIFTTQNFALYFRNSFFVTVLSILITVFVSILLSYALARYKMKYVNPLSIYFLAGMMIPIRLGVLYINELLNTLNLIDSLIGLILVYTAMTIPFSMFIFMGFIKMVPVELDESAYIDGCSERKILFRIIAPLIKPAVATVTIYNFVPIWNDVYFPLIFIHSPEKKTLLLAVTIFFGQFQTDWSLVFSALTVATIPVLTIYLVGSKYFIRGLTSGALKG
ncbi:MAG: carbohydrate ABC transporter permease [Nitrospiraceae bacterium]|nr:MAG: carbohydrate ABC transporter permease [Nitrospiraceae bacterium]